MPAIDQEEPIFLYYDPHPVHERMAESVDAEFVQCETGGPMNRIRAGATHDFGDRPVLLEGGVPLLEGAALRALGNAGPLVALGADSTYHDLVDSLPDRTRASRIAHRVGLFAVDGTLAVSERIATLAERFSGNPVRVCHPFVQADLFDALRKVEPTLNGERVLCVGKYRKKNGQDRLVEAVQQADTDLTLTFVGPDTESLDGEYAEGLGFVDEDRLVDLYESAALFAFPAIVGAFPVATLEALVAGLPVLANGRVGTGTLVRGVHPRLAVTPKPSELADRLDWYFNLESERRYTLSERARGYGGGFTEETGLEGFQLALQELLAELENNV